MPHIFWDSDPAKWIEAVGYSIATHPNPESEQQVTPTPFTLRAIPYCFWANREAGEMRVWIREA